ncbi:MAG: 3-methyl-2-oxobutanoate hydroxymethyltransferase [Peptostreptococcaceae bacterium]|nr:3-methyl-2-oxobutanoate hydroxymethyltransferase [Peptostreptococcaceae bacterium]
MKNTISTFKDAKIKGEKITMLTAYDYTNAKLVDEAGINGILVGDSLGMVILGYENTLPVTIEDMIHHTKAVSRGTKNALIVGDMPFMSFHGDINTTVMNAGRLVKEGGAHCVKLEGGVDFCEEIRAITRASIPVMGHIGLTPQSFNAFGGFKIQGKNAEGAQKILDDARALEEAGAFAIVLECVPAKLAEKITKTVSIPTIGIGAGVGCDGQILVMQDMLGMYTDFTPKFVKKFEHLGEKSKEAYMEYIDEVKNEAFPEEKHSFAIDDEIIEKLV